MSVLHPPCTFFQSHFTRRSPSVEDALEHGSTTWLLAFSIVFDSLVVIVPALGATYALGLTLGIQQYILMVPAAFALPIIMIGWNLAWLDWHAPVFSQMFWGGTVYIIEDASEHLGLAIEVGVAEHPHVRGVVEAVIPGILFFSPAELREFKPSYRYVQIPWTTEAIMATFQRQHTRRFGW